MVFFATVTQEFQKCQSEKLLFIPYFPETPPIPNVEVTSTGLSIMDIMWTISGPAPDEFEIEFYPTDAPDEIRVSLYNGFLKFAVLGLHLMLHILGNVVK